MESGLNGARQISSDSINITVLPSTPSFILNIRLDIETEKVIQWLGFDVLQPSREALFLAGKSFLQYRRNKGRKNNVLPDFFIGAHAAVEQYRLATDMTRFSTYFPTLDLITP